MRKHLGVGIFICGACAQAVDAPSSTEPPNRAVVSSALTTDADGSRTVTLELGQAHVLEFTESLDAAWFFERRPLEVAPVVDAAADGPSLYREFRQANPELPELFADYPAKASAPNIDQQVGASINALTKEEFLGGDGICNHYCDSVEFQEHSTYPFVTTEKCRTDILGRDFRPIDDAPQPTTDTLAFGEKFFSAVNARDTGGTFSVHRYIQQWTFAGVEVLDYQQSPVSTKTRVIERGEAFSGGSTVKQTGESNVYRRGTTWAQLIGDDASTYDFYTCAAVSRSTPSSQPGQ